MSLSGGCLLKELCDEENSVPGDESQKHGFIEVVSHKFTDSENGNNEEFSFD